MSCPLSTGYQVPCRQLSGVKDVYLAGKDGTFSISSSKSLSGIYVAYQDTPEGGSDTYTAGTYTKTLKFLSSDTDLYTNLNADTQYYLPNTWIDATITFTIGPVPGDTTELQPISVAISNIVNNYGMDTSFVIALSSITGIPYVDNGDSVLIQVTITQGNTYQIAHFNKNFYHFTQRLEQASFLESAVYSLESISYNQKLEITLEGYDANTMKIVDTLNRARLRAIIVDQNNNYYLVGNINYLQTSSGEGGLGKTTTDGVKTTLLLEGKELLPALQLDNTVVLNGILIG